MYRDIEGGRMGMELLDLHDGGGVEGCAKVRTNRSDLKDKA